MAKSPTNRAQATPKNRRVSFHRGRGMPCYRGKCERRAKKYPNRHIHCIFWLLCCRFFEILTDVAPNALHATNLCKKGTINWCVPKPLASFSLHPHERNRKRLVWLVHHLANHVADDATIFVRYCIRIDKLIVGDAHGECKILSHYFQGNGL